MIYNSAKRRLFAGLLNLAAADLRVALLMTGADADDPDPDSLAGIATLDECDDAAYSRAALAGKTVAEDNGSDAARFDADDLPVPNDGDGSRPVAHALIYEHVDGTAANDRPVALLTFPNPITLDGNVTTIVWDPAGLITLEDAA